MPSHVAVANPVGVFPKGLCSAFSEELRIEPLINVYPDGSSDRAALAINPRRWFKLTRPLRSADYSLLFTFYQAHRAQEFYFYNLRETVPMWSYDPTGSATSGRYIVVFDGGWSEENYNPRFQASLALREVA